MSGIKVDVGTPPSGFQNYELAEVNFHGFKNLPAARGDRTDSPEFTCLGNEWCLDVFPGGDDDSDDGMVAIGLVHKSDESIEIEYYFSIRDATNNEVANSDFGSQLFAPKDDADGNDGWGIPNFARRSKLVKALVNGTLTVEVRMRKYDRTNEVVAHSFLKIRSAKIF